MTYNYNHGKLYPSIVEISGASYPYMLGDARQERHALTTQSTYTKDELHAVGESFPAARLSSTHGSNHYPYPVDPDLSQGFNMASTVQSPIISPSYAPQGTGIAMANLQLGQPYATDSNGSFLSHATHPHGQYSSHGYPNSSYANSNNGPFQPARPSPSLEPFHNPIVTAGTSVKPHPCPKCGKSFKRKADMERHAGKHGPRNLWCDAEGCRSKGFYRKDKFEEHKRRHETR